MADRPLFTDEAARTGANVIASSIADPLIIPATTGKIRLFTAALVPDVGTTRAELLAAEVVGGGYPVGGYTLTGFASAVRAPLGGAIITSNLVNVVADGTASVSVGGYWVEEPVAAGSDVREVYIYDPPRALNVVGDGWPIVVQMGYGANASL